LTKTIPDPIELLKTELTSLLAPPQTHLFANKQLKMFFKTNRLTKAQIEKLRVYIREQHLLTPLNIKWNNSDDAKAMVSGSRELSLLQLGKELYLHSYYTHESALYALGILENPPLTLTLAKERKNYGRKPKSFLLTDAIIQEQMNKPPRTNKRTATFKDYTFNFLEREQKELLGVITLSNRESGSDNILSTDVNRTLIDLATHPELAGGLSSNLDLWKKKKKKEKDKN